MIEHSYKNQVLTVKLNRPEKRNALNQELVEGLHKLLIDFESQADCRVVLIKGNGKVFCSGADLEYLQSLRSNSFEENLDDSQSLKALYEHILKSSKVFVAMLEGHAIAGGAGLATVCDYCFSVPDAKLGYTESKIGFVPALVMVFLVRKVSGTVARDLLLSGRLVKAKEALDLGLINAVIDPNEIEAYCDAFISKLIETTSPNSIATIKEMLFALPKMSIEEGLNYAAEMNAKARSSADCIKGIDSFLAKTKISWKQV